MIRRILIPTDGSDAAEKGWRYALELAKRHGASLVGLHVVDVRLLEGPFLRDLSASLGTAPYVNYQGNISMLLEERGKLALELLKKTADEVGVPCEIKQETGIVSRCIVDEGGLTDLIVMGRGGEHDEWLDGVLGSTAEAVVRRSKQPVLITATDTPGSRLAVVAYDGTPHAKQALKVSALVAAEWKIPFHLLVVGDEESRYLLDEAKTYLQSHEALNITYTLQAGDPGEVIVAYVTEQNADLLVIGAYGHSKMRELVIGSTCSFVLNQAPCPVLLAH